jgi:hypothetical protein
VVASGERGMMCNHFFIQGRCKICGRYRYDASVSSVPDAVTYDFGSTAPPYMHAADTEPTVTYVIDTPTIDTSTADTSFDSFSGGDSGGGGSSSDW